MTKSTTENMLKRAKQLFMLKVFNSKYLICFNIFFYWNETDEILNVLKLLALVVIREHSSCRQKAFGNLQQRKDTFFITDTNKQC